MKMRLHSNVSRAAISRRYWLPAKRILAARCGVVVACPERNRRNRRTSSAVAAVYDRRKNAANRQSIFTYSCSSSNTNGTGTYTWTIY
jgi:hypothetical protein